MSRDRQAKPTAADQRAARELKRRWLAIPRQLRPTQDQLAERYGEGGSQSLISQYLTGRIPLNIRALLFFAREFGCAPQEIYPDMPGVDALTDLYRSATGRPYPQGVAEPDRLYFFSHAAAAHKMQALDREWQSFSADKKRGILELVRKAEALAAPAVTAAKTRGKRR